MTDQPLTREARSERKLLVPSASPQPAFTPTIETAALDVIRAHERVEQAILAVPTGPTRDLLTSIDLQLQIVLNALRNTHDGIAAVHKFNELLSGDLAARDL